jgi:hypothetical protein
LCGAFDGPQYLVVAIGLLKQPDNQKLPRSCFVPLQNASDHLRRDMVTEIGQGAGDPILAPAGVLPGHTDDRASIAGSISGRPR